MRTEWLIPILVLVLGGCAGAGRTKDAAGGGSDALTLLSQADAAYARGAWAQAESRYRAVIRRVPQDPYAWFKLGNLFIRSGRPDQAIDAYREALVRNGKYGKAYHNLGIAYLMEARQALQTSLSAGGVPASQTASTRMLLQRLTTLVSGGDSGASPAAKAPRATRRRQARAAPAGILAEQQRLSARIIARQPDPDNPVPRTKRLAGAQSGPVIIEVGGKRAPDPVATTSASPAASGDARPDPVLIRVDEPIAAAKRHARHETAHKAGPRFKVLPPGLIVHARPETGAPAIARLAQGAIVQGLPTAKNPLWRRVRYRNRQGWVLARYLLPESRRSAPRVSAGGTTP